MSFTIAACQLPDVQNDTQETFKKIAHYLQVAEQKNIDIVCFPECYFQGYTRDKATALHRAIHVKNQELKKLVSLTRDSEVTVILGIIEQNEKSLFNTAVVMYKGQLIGKYQKTHPNEGIFKPGSAYPTFKPTELSFGINICNDANYPEAAEKLLQGNPKIIFYPLNNKLPFETAEKWKDTHLQNLIERAQQTKCWIVSADVVGKDSTSVGYGFSAIVNPRGRVVARARELTEEMITASI